jgi:hypothetical protein
MGERRWAVVIEVPGRDAAIVMADHVRGSLTDGCLADRAKVRVTRLRPRSKAADKGRPTVVCLCGSTRFYDQFQRAYYEETMAGRIVLSVGFYSHSSEKAHGEHVGCTPEQKVALDELHKRKIDLADEVLILNVGGYVGESTRSELEYAEAHGKAVRWLEPAAAPPASPAPAGTIPEALRVGLESAKAAPLVDRGSFADCSTCDSDGGLACRGCRDQEPAATAGGWLIYDSDDRDYGDSGGIWNSDITIAATYAYRDRDAADRVCAELATTYRWPVTVVPAPTAEPAPEARHATCGTKCADGKPCAAFPGHLGPCVSSLVTREPAPSPPAEPTGEAGCDTEYHADLCRAARRRVLDEVREKVEALECDEDHDEVGAGPCPKRAVFAILDKLRGDGKGGK